MGNQKNVNILYETMRVDKEVTSSVKKAISKKERSVDVVFTSENIKHLRSAVKGFLDLSQLVIETIAKTKDL